VPLENRLWKVAEKEEVGSKFGGDGDGGEQLFLNKMQKLVVFTSRRKWRALAAILRFLLLLQMLVLDVL
jgi:hypothetical protein